jgi:F-type H+-transporting ATPase subunit delta
MAEKNTIARPYAEAAFEIAHATGALKPWSEMLQALARVAADPDMEKLIDNPEVEDAVVVGLFTELCGPVLTDKGADFVRVLAENERLGVLPEIAALFDLRRAEAEKTIEAVVTSAFPLSDARLQEIASALAKRLGREVTLKTNVDESMIGGAVVRAGDVVIDASVTSQLQKLATRMLR